MQKNAAFFRIHQTRDNIQHSGLSAAARAQEYKELPIFDLERNTVHHSLLSVSPAYILKYD
jgi:hypothetical protein